jgi:hypothetical protein
VIQVRKALHRGKIVSPILKAKPVVGTATISRIPASKRPFYRSLHEIADKASPQIANQIIDAFTSIQSKAKMNQLSSAIDAQDLNGILAALGISSMDKEMQPMINALRSVFVDAAEESMKFLPKAVQQGLRFDMLNPRSVDFLRTRSSLLITNISDNTRKGVQKILAEGLEQGLTPSAIASQIRDKVGLLPRQVSAVENYRRLLISEGRDPAQIKRMVDKYKARQLRYRANMIARTETIAASNMGQEEIWQQAMDEGLLKPNAKKKWVVTPDDRLCPVCKAIPKKDANKNGVPIGAFFETDVGPRQSPPAHPHCRCAVTLV